jgi:hypothetical protein
MFQIFGTVKFYICFICYDVFHILLSWDSLWIHGMYVWIVVFPFQLASQNIVQFSSLLCMLCALLFYF